MLLACLVVGATLTSSVHAADFSTAIAGRVFCDANCNGKIDVDVDELMMKTKVQLWDDQGNLLATTTPEVFGGTYIFPDLVAGKKYIVKVVPAVGQTAIKAVPANTPVGAATALSKTSISVVVVNQGDTYYPEDFLLSCCTVGYNQCEWGYDSCGFSPIDLIKSKFDDLFPNGVVIGGNKTYTFTSWQAVLRFLPTTGYPKAFSYNRIDPSSYQGNEFAGNVLALTLNIAISDAGITTEGYGDRVLPSGKFAGWKVRDILALANQVLGGDSSNLPAGKTICNLNDTIEGINDFSSCCGGCGGHNSGGCGGHSGSNGCGGGWSGGWSGGHGGGNGCGGGWGGCHSGW